MVPSVDYRFITVTNVVVVVKSFEYQTTADLVQLEWLLELSLGRSENKHHRHSHSKLLFGDDLTKNVGRTMAKHSLNKSIASKKIQISPATRS